MPYINDANRREKLLPVSDEDPQNAGELNYQLTSLCMAYIDANRLDAQGNYTRRLDYQTINDILGALEGAKQEFYRRVAAPYENKKIVANGDVYP